MGDTTNISWTDSSWNPWQGCRKVSPGCAHCYAERLVRDRMGRDFRDIRKSQAATFYAPLRWKSPRKVFTCSISDFFIEQADEWRPEVWEIIRKTPQHTYQILTKRPERIAQHLPPDWGEGWSNVWLGTSVESQLYSHRIELLRRVPARIHFLSCEPLIAPLTFRADGDRRAPSLGPLPLLYHIEWVIAGGESGPDFRPSHDAWFKMIQLQCAEANVPFWFKQHAGLRSETEPTLGGIVCREFPVD